MILRELRKQHHMTQAELALKVNATRETIARIETGTRRASPDLAKRIKKAFGLTEEEAWKMLFGDDEQTADARK